MLIGRRLASSKRMHALNKPGIQPRKSPAPIRIGAAGTMTTRYWRSLMANGPGLASTKTNADAGNAMKAGAKTMHRTNMPVGLLITHRCTPEAP
jgi:hypothetical protein